MEYLEQHWIDLSREEAEAYLEQFLREQPERLEQLVRLSESSGGPRPELLDYSPQSLVPLWRWARQRLSWNAAYEPPAVIGDPPRHVPVREDLPPPGEVPSWAGAHPREFARFSAETLWLIDMITRYFAEVLRRANPDACWQVAHSRISGEVNENQPVLKWAAGNVNPRSILVVIASRELWAMADPDGEELKGAFDTRMGQLRSRGGQAEAQKATGALDLFDVGEYDPEGEWTYDVYLDDWFAAVGEDHVTRLIADLSADARIVEVHHEDREHLLVNAPDLSREALEELVRGWFERHEDEIRATIEVE